MDPRQPRAQLLVEIRAAHVHRVVSQATPTTGRGMSLPLRPGGYTKSQCKMCKLTMWSDGAAAQTTCGACRMLGRSHMCGICLEYCRPVQTVNCSDAHPVCGPCLGKYVEVNVSDGKAEHKCPYPQCDRSIPERAISKLCPPGYISKECLQQQKALRAQDHCAQVRSLLAGGGGAFEWARSNTQVCPHCYALVQRSEGCNHMTCLCGKEFCYFCGESYPLPPSHRNHGRDEQPRLNIDLLGPDGLPLFVPPAEPPAAAEPPLPSAELAPPAVQCAPCDGAAADAAAYDAVGVAGATPSAKGGVLAAASALPCTLAEARERLLSLFTLRCPNARCQQAICMEDAFADCFALACGRCSSRFCAWCLRLASAHEDPHGHVLDCSAAPEDMRGSALYLQDHNGGPHEAPRPKAKFTAHWRAVLRARAEAMLSEMAKAAGAATVAGADADGGATTADGAAPYEPARDEPALRELIELHLGTER